MRKLSLAWGAGALALLAEGALVGWVPRAWFPDLGLLLAVAFGIRLEGAVGIASAWGVGAVADLLSAAPAGSYALLRLLAWAVTRLANRRFHLTRPALVALYAAWLSLADALALAGLAAALGIGIRLEPRELAALAQHAMANALAAPLVLAGFTRLLGRAQEGARSARLATRPSVR